MRIVGPFLFVLFLSAVLMAKDKPCKLDPNSWSFKSHCSAVVASDCKSAMEMVKTIAASRYYQVSVDTDGMTLYISARPQLTHKVMMGIFAPDRHAAIKFLQAGHSCDLRASGSGSVAHDIIKRLHAKATTGSSSIKATVTAQQAAYSEQRGKPSADPNYNSALDRSGRVRQ